jgi:hypothetical protein
MSHKFTAQICKQFKTGKASELAGVVDFQLKGERKNDSRINTRKFTSEPEDVTD